MKFSKDQKDYLLDKMQGASYTDAYLMIVSLDETDFELLKVNTLLYTKDGKKVGNAIIVEATKLENSAYYTVMTDYGKPLLFNAGEIHNLFLVGEVANEDHKHFTQQSKTQQQCKTKQQAEKASHKSSLTT